MKKQSILDKNHDKQLNLFKVVWNMLNTMLKYAIYMDERSIQYNFN